MIYLVATMKSINNFNHLLSQIKNLKGLSFSVLKSWGYTPAEAEQEALIILWEMSKSTKVFEYPKTYLCRILFNAQIDKTRGLKNTSEHVYLDADNTNLQLISPDKETNQDFFWKITKGLPHTKRTLMFRYYVLGLSEKELAVKYSCKLGTIKSRLSRVCAKVKNSLEVEVV